MCGFDGVRTANYFGRVPIRRTEVEVRVGKLKNRKVAVKDEVTGVMIKVGNDMVLDWIWKMCNIMAFESGVPDDWRSALIVGIVEVCLLSVVVKIYAGILVDRACRMI